MNITCIQAQALSQEGSAVVIRASFILDGLVTLTDVTVALNEAIGVADISLPTPAEGNVPTTPGLAFQTVFARRAFAALLAKALGEYVAAVQAAKQFQSLGQTINTLESAVSMNTRELLSRVKTGGVN
ncbi:MAG: hypothetical protein ABSH56_11885 [Bryobacteraceae bacterium]|jgi:hypothetical protein